MKKSKQIKELQFKLSSANAAINSQMRHIEMLNRQLDQLDKVIKRKDAQFLGLRSAYQDDLIIRRICFDDL